MAESSTQDVALNTSSVGAAPSEITATTTIKNSVEGDTVEEQGSQESTTIIEKESQKVEENQVDEGSARLDTDTPDARPVKKFAVTKPVSFAKYTLPKTLTTNAPPKQASDKVVTSTPVQSSTQTLGRPRLVAKTTSSLQTKPSAFKPQAPDPNQVWNKNRVTTQPSTKHLTDEELKQQYGIHLTTRLQTDGEGKEAKWADIDDDEDDWVPETIEWNDGTKTTVNHGEALAPKANGAAKLPAAGLTKTEPPPPKVLTPSYSTSIGPNATVLKIGANVERQQAQKAAQQVRGSDKASLQSGKTAPAPAPVKSPWAKLPDIEKVSPVAINPQPPLPTPTSKLASPTSQISIPSPAKEISADDFSRQWKNSPTSQTKELFMPGSGKYEAVSDGRRRMSRNEQSFRAPAVLQRPSQSDIRGPAEPSAAFQTNRTSTDQARRRASSSISGTSGQFARRMSFKSSDMPPPPVVDEHRSTYTESNEPRLQSRPQSQDGPASQMQTPAYQARGGDYLSAGHGAAGDSNIEAQLVAQKALMKERNEQARKRKMEEIQRAEAEKQDRIRAKLAALGPDPKLQSKTEKAADIKDTPSATQSSIPAVTPASQSPPKPPQPQATGEPQQYGMMKVHAMDSVKKPNHPVLQAADPTKSPAEHHNHVSAPAPQASPDKQTASPLTNGIHVVSEPQIPLVESEIANPEPSPRFSRPSAPANTDARAVWTNTRGETRAPQASSLWGLPHNKALGNGTFDQSLAGYSPQDLSRTSSTGQGWMNNRTPTVGQSPQLHHAVQPVPETRSHLLQTMTSPGQQPLALNSEVDSIPSISRPAPIGPPQAHNVAPGATAVAGWNHFHLTARAQERAETERINREFDERREEERRGGARQVAPYNFDETFKQVQLGEQVGRRHVSTIAQTTLPPTSAFGVVGSPAMHEYPARLVNGQSARGSRFFPQQANGMVMQERRAVTYSHPEPFRTPSPPPAEELASLHPAFDGRYLRPVVHFPREKAVVRLPPAAPPVPPSPIRETPPPAPQAPMTWAARVQMAPPPPPPPAPTPQRTVSQPIHWQEKFNGLLGKTRADMAPIPAETSTKLPLEVVTGTVGASVSLPDVAIELSTTEDMGPVTTKDVEDEEDLFEDREAGSLPTVQLPRDSSVTPLPRSSLPRLLQIPVESTSVHMYMVSNWSERHASGKPQYAIIKIPGPGSKTIRKDLAGKDVEGTNLARSGRSVSGPVGHKFPRYKTGMKPRPMAKAH